MQKRSKIHRHASAETGSVLLLVAASMVMLLGVSAFAIDLANFYLTRAQAQRAADAAALAGAKAFVTSGCTTAGCIQGGPQDTLARQMAKSTGAQNYVAGQLANIQDGDVVLNEANPYEPQVTVTVRRAAPTFFAKIFGIDTANISASATAEAYAGNGGAQLWQQCLKPFLVPNCDPDHASPVPTPNPCPEGYGAFFTPGVTGGTNTVANPGPYSQGGIIGEHWQLHTGADPSQWYLVGFGGAPPSSGNALYNHILECSPKPLSCGTTLVTANGNMVGPVSQGINQLIGAQNYGMNQGQDSINTTSDSSFIFTAGSSNPNTLLRGQTFTDYSESPSVVTVPVYTGGSLAPGGSVVGIVGYLQVFIQDVVHNGNDNHIDVVILNSATCGSDPANTNSSSNTSGTVIGAAGSPISIRLIRTK